MGAEETGTAFGEQPVADHGEDDVDEAVDGDDEPVVDEDDSTGEGGIDDGEHTPEGNPVVDYTPMERRCGGEDQPERCDADPSTFENYGPASLVSFFEVSRDEECCADFDGDGDPDNAAGAGFAGVDRLRPLNRDILSALENGEQVIFFEFDGVDTSEDDFRLAVWHGEWDGFDAITDGETHPVAIDPRSIDDGVEPLLTFDSAKISDGKLLAQQGTVLLSSGFYDFPLNIELRDVTLEADVVSLSSGGIRLENGRLGARVEVAQLYRAMNDYAASCSCLGLDGDLVDYELFDNPGECRNVKADTCVAAGEETCAAVAEACPYIDTLAPYIADVDADGDGVVESISLGAQFGAHAAEITGVAR